MAIGVSGVIPHKIYNDYYIAKHGYSYVDVYYEEEYDVPTNSSVIVITKITFRHSLYGGTWSVYGSVTIDGVEYEFGQKLSSGGVIERPIVSHSIPHDAISGGKTITISTACNTVGGSGGTQFYAGNHGTAIVTVPLTNIPRTSTLKVTDGVIGSPMSLTIDRGSNVFTHTLRYSFGNTSGVIAERTGAGAVTWTPPMALCSQIPNAGSGVCALTCETYNGTEYIGKTAVAVYLSVPDGVGLRLQDGWATAMPYNAGTAAAALTAYVQGYSKAQVQFDAGKISAADAYGATVAAFGIVYRGTAIAAPYCTSVLQNAGTEELVCKVTDSRGRTQTQTLQIAVQPYAKPTLSGISLFRCGSDGAEDDEGTYVSVTATGGFSSIAEQNDVVLEMKVGNVVSCEIPNGVTTVLGDGAVLHTSTYPVTLTVTDRLGNKSVFTDLLPTAEVMFHGRKGGKGAAFGKYGEADDLLDVDWHLRVRKALQVDGTLTVDGALTVEGKGLEEIVAEGSEPLRYMPVGYVYMSLNATSPAQLFGGTWQQYKDRFLVGAGNSYGAGATGGSNTVTLTANQIPSHDHTQRAWFVGWSGWDTRTTDAVYAFNRNTTVLANTDMKAYTGNASHVELTKTVASGGGASHENRPPYLAVYMWIRTA